MHCVFRTASGSAVDPTTVTTRIKNGTNGVVTTYVYPSSDPIIRESTGTFYFDYTVNAGGDWYYRFEASGAVTAAAEGTFFVDGGSF